MSIPSYGEPWRTIRGPDEFCVYDNDDDVIASFADDSGGPTQMERLRAVACVNALAGMDPEKLAPLLLAVAETLCWFDVRPGSHITTEHRLRSALAALRGEKP